MFQVFSEPPRDAHLPLTTGGCSDGPRCTLGSPQPPGGTPGAASPWLGEHIWQERCWAAYSPLWDCALSLLSPPPGHPPLPLIWGKGTVPRVR